MNTKEIKVTLKEREGGLYDAIVNGIRIGSTNTWFDNTYAAGYTFGIIARRASGLDVKGNDRAIHYIDTPDGALQALKEVITFHLTTENGIAVTFENA